MGMSVWGLIAAPLMTQAAPAPHQEAAPPIAAAEADIFADEAILNTQMMSDAAGGNGIEIELDDVGINLANSTASVEDVSIGTSQTGQIAGNTISNNHGFTTSIFNSGSGVSITSTLQVNIFLGDATTQ